MTGEDTRDPAKRHPRLAGLRATKHYAIVTMGIVPGVALGADRQAR